MARKSLKNSKNFIFWKIFAKLQNSPKKKYIGEHKTNVLNDIFITNQIPTSKDIMINVFSTPKYIQNERYLFNFRIW